MENFSIEPCLTTPPIAQWSDYLAFQLYSDFPQKTDDPLFLQKLGVVQAEHLRRTMVACASAHARTTTSGLKYIDESRRQDMRKLGREMQRVSNALASQLEGGFASMNYSLTEVSKKQDIANAFLHSIDDGIRNVNESISHIGQTSQAIAAGIQGINQRLNSINAQSVLLNENLKVLNLQIDHYASLGIGLLDGISFLLNQIAKEQRLPEYARESRFHVESAMKFIRMAVERKNARYYDDAFEELLEASRLNARDYNVWFYLGYLHLYSVKHLDMPKAVEAFEQFFYYAPNDAQQWDEACMHLATSHYMMRNPYASLKAMMRIKNETPKSLLLNAKYLSCCDCESDRLAALVPLKTILKKWPRALMMVLEDADLLRSPHVVKFIDAARNGLNANARKHLDDLLPLIKNLKNRTADEIKRLTMLGKTVGFTPHFTPLDELDSGVATVTDFIAKNTFMDALAAKNVCSKLMMRWYYLEKQINEEIQKNNETLNNLTNNHKAILAQKKAAQNDILSEINLLDIAAKSSIENLRAYEFLMSVISELINSQPYTEDAVFTHIGGEIEEKISNFGSSILKSQYDDTLKFLQFIKSIICEIKALHIEMNKEKFHAKLLVTEIQIGTRFDASKVFSCSQKLREVTVKLKTNYYLDMKMIVLSQLFHYAKVVGEGYYEGPGFFLMEHMRWKNVKNRVIKRNRPFVEACHKANAKLLAYCNKHHNCPFSWCDHFK